MFSSNLLKAKMLENNKSAEDVSAVIGINLSTFYRKLNGASEFNRSEMLLIKSCLGLSKEEMDSIFFS